MSKQCSPKENWELFRTATNALSQMTDNALLDLEMEDPDRALVISQGIKQGAIKVLIALELSALPTNKVNFTIIGPDDKKYPLFNFAEERTFN